MPTPPSLYLDECFNHLVIPALLALGYMVMTVSGEDTRGNDDASQLVFAAERNLLFITHNHRHYYQLHQAYQRDGRSHGGILTLPQGRGQPGDVALERLTLRLLMMLAWIAPLPTYRNRFFQWGDLQRELIRGLRLPGYSERDVRIVLGQEP